MKTIFHATFGILSFCLILTSLLASVVVEFWYSQAEIADVKSFVYRCIKLLLALLIFTALLGLSLAKTRQGNIVNNKKKRMVWIFAVATLFLLPISYVLNEYAGKGQFNWFYFFLQSIEYVFDIILLVLLGLNVRDGNTLVRQSRDRF